MVPAGYDNLIHVQRSVIPRSFPKGGWLLSDFLETRREVTFTQIVTHEKVGQSYGMLCYRTLRLPQVYSSIPHLVYNMC